LGHVDWVLVPYGDKEINSKKKKLGLQDVVKVVKMDVTRPFCIKDTRKKFLTFRQQPNNFNYHSIGDHKVIESFPKT